jgi:hypothetical protein
MSGAARRPLVGAIVAVLLAAGVAWEPGTVVAQQSPGQAVSMPPSLRSAGVCTAGWRTVGIPHSAFRSTPFGIVTRNGRPAWLVGGTRTGILALRWRDGGWRDPDVASRGFRGLTGAAATAASRLVGVGYLRPQGGGLASIAGNLRGTTWGEQRVPNVPGAATLSGVALGTDGSAWAVGTSTQRGASRAVLLRRVGGTWRRPDPRALRGDAGLTSAAVTPNGTVWVAGWRRTANGRLRPLIARRVGKGWQRVPPPADGAGSAVVTGLAFRGASNGWATGYLVAAGASRHVPTLHRWNGTEWRAVDLPWAADASAVLRSVAADGAGRVWLAGTWLATAEREARGFVAVREAGEWTVRDLAVPAEVRSELLTIVATSGGAMAAGTVGATNLVLETCPEDVASTGRRVQVGELRARRSVPDEEDLEHDDDGRVSRAAARLPALPARVAPVGFRVRNVATQVGLEAQARTYGGLAADLDGDGWTDIFFSRHGGLLPRVYMGGPDGFTRAEPDAFSVVDRHLCAAADVDDDGALDILCAVGRSRGTAIHRHELSLRVGHADARLAGNALGVSDPFGRGLAATFIRLAPGAAPDLYITTSAGRVDGLPGPNRYFRNVGGRFVAAPEMGLDRPIGGRCAVTADIDGDGDEDLLVCAAVAHDGLPAGLRVYRNEGGRLVDRTRALGIRPMRDVDVVVADITGNGRPDIVQLAPDRLRVSRGTPNGFVTRYEARLRWGASIAAGDVDGDGRPDLYVLIAGPDNKPDHLLLNRRGGREWVSVRIPQASGGSGDTVIALDHDRNGLMDFLVLNGRAGGPGPVQLLASYPRP